MWHPGRLAKNAIRGTAAYGIRLALQVVYFLLLARWLGVSQFGTFAGVWVLCGFLATFAGLGFPVLLFRTTSLAPDAAQACAKRGLRMIAMTGLPLSLLLVGFVLFRMEHRPALMVLAMLATSEICLVPVLTLLSSAHQGNERLARAHTIFALLWACRIAGLLLLHVSLEVDLQALALTHTSVTACITVFWVAIERNLLSSPASDRQIDWHELSNGLYFAISGAAMIAYTELNQTIMLSVDGATAAGLLAVAYKLVALFSAPLAAACQAIAPRLLRAARENGNAFRHLAMVISGPLLLYAVACGGGAYLASFLISDVFGTAYAAAAPVARGLCLLPTFSAVRLLAAYALMAMSSQRNRVIAELACLIVGISLNFWLIERIGLAGAVVAMLLTEAITACTLGLVAKVMHTRHVNLPSNERDIVFR